MNREGWMLYSELAQKNELVRSGSVIEGEVQPDLLPARIHTMDLVRFEHDVRLVLTEIAKDVRSDPGHAASDQYRSVMRRKLERCVELLEEGL